MKSVRKALQEADKWTTLTTEIEDIIDSSDLEQISNKLTQIQGSLKILSKVPDFQEVIKSFITPYLAPFKESQSRGELEKSPGGLRLAQIGDQFEPK